MRQKLVNLAYAFTRSQHKAQPHFFGVGNRCGNPAIFKVFLVDEQQVSRSVSQRVSGKASRHQGQPRTGQLKIKEQELLIFADRCIAPSLTR
jgi:hypothetical protein